MTVTTASRDISELSATAQQACKLLFQECYKSGITDIFITEGYRSQARQNYLYEQGRTRPGNKVTWTKNSNHTSRRAWDIAVAPPKSLYDVTTLNKVGAIARKLGITWGGDWTGSVDRPHFEVASNWKMPAVYKLEGQVVIPMSSKDKVQLIVEGGDSVSKSNEINKPSSWAATSWEEATKNGYFDGTRPLDNITRQEDAIVINRLRGNLLDLIKKQNAKIGELEDRIKALEK